MSDVAPHTAILTEKQDKIGIITLNRPQVLNALNDPLIDELVDALQGFDADDSIRVMVLQGSAKAFAAGADISAMASLDFATAYHHNFISRNWDAIKRIRKPIIASVSGFALGGGCELVMMCDVVIAADNAKFGQPEIKLGVLPGAGGTQRLPRAVGKAKAMDLCLTGRMMTAQEAEHSGLVSRVVPAAELQTATLEIATTMASYATDALMMVKEAVLQAYEMPLSAGLDFERRLFHASFATAHQKEGMAAFLEKRPAVF
jgi:enoyl-CoA hydratase